jgi:hypothetical protein
MQPLVGRHGWQTQDPPAAGFALTDRSMVNYGPTSPVTREPTTIMVYKHSVNWPCGPPLLPSHCLHAYGVQSSYRVSFSPYEWFSEAPLPAHPEVAR